MLTWGLQFGVGEIIWGLKFRGSKCATCGLKFGVGEIIWSLIFLVCHHASNFSGIKFFFSKTGQLIIWGLSKSWSDYLGSQNLIYWECAIAEDGLTVMTYNGFIINLSRSRLLSEINISRMSGPTFDHDT